MEVVAFENPDHGLVVVALNRTDEKHDFVLEIDGKIAEIESPAHSILSLITGGGAENGVTDLYKTA